MDRPEPSAPAGDLLLLRRYTLAGWPFHAGPQHIAELAEGTALALVRERDNPHDARAVAVHFRGERIGYVPAADNKDLVATALDELTVRVARANAEEVTHVSVFAPLPEILRQLNTHQLPPPEAIPPSPILDDAREGRLLTALPLGLTAAAASADDLEHELNWLLFAQADGATGGRWDDHPDVPYWERQQAVYLVREAPEEEGHERVSVWLPGARKLGYLGKDPGLRLLRAVDGGDANWALRAFLTNAAPEHEAYFDDGHALLTVKVFRPTLATHGVVSEDWAWRLDRWRLAV